LLQDMFKRQIAIYPILSVLRLQRVGLTYRSSFADISGRILGCKIDWDAVIWTMLSDARRAYIEYLSEARGRHCFICCKMCCP
jgi:hypothetical protein